MAAATCKICREPLQLHLHPDGVEEPDDQPTCVEDDLQLGCGCHFHWQCFMDKASELAISLKCPGCNSHMVAQAPGPSTTNQFRATDPGISIVAKYTNEGGEQHVDLLPELTEEAYVEANPEARPGRALRAMAAEGDVAGIIEMLRYVSDEFGDLGPIIRYQDPSEDMKSAMHLAILSAQQEAAWLLLWLSSSVPTEAFPSHGREMIQSMGINRLAVTADQDVRGLRDEQGLRPVDLALEFGEPWRQMLEAGILS